MKLRTYSKFLPDRPRAFTIGCFFSFFAITAQAEWRLYGLASLGEAPFRMLSDVGGSTAVPQTGVSIEYGTKFLTPFSKASVGYYNHGLFAEEYVGVQAGAAISWLKPSLTFGKGIQIANEKEYTLGDEFETNRKVYYPWGFSARLDAFERVYGEWDWRVEGFPWWKLEFGLRLL